MNPLRIPGKPLNVDRSHEKKLQTLLKGLRALNEPMDLEEVLQRLVQVGQSLFACDRCAVYLFDEKGKLQAPASAGLSQAYLEAVRDHSPWPADIPQKPEPVLIPDALKAPELSSLQGVIEREGVRSILFVPLYHERLLGKLALYHDRPNRTWTQEELELAQALADQAVLAVIRTQEQGRLRQHNEALRKLQELSTAWLQPGRKREDLIQEALEVAADLVDADASGLYLYDAKRDELVLEEILGLPEETRHTRLDDREKGLGWQVFQRGEPLFINDYPHWPGRSEQWAKRGLLAALGVPLQREGRRIGVLVAGRFHPRRTGFSSVEASLIQLLANQLAAALEWLRLREVQRQAAEIGASLLKATTLPEVLGPIVRALIEQSPFRVAGVLVFRRPRPLEDPEPPDVAGVYLEGLPPEQERALHEMARERRLLPNRPIVERGRRIGAAYHVTPKEVPELTEVSVPVPGKAREGVRQEARWGEHDTLVFFLEVEGRVLGRITLADPVHGQIPTPEELEPLETLVQLAAWAVQKARYQERLQALYRVSGRLVEFSSLKALYQGTLRLVGEIFDYEYGALLLARDGGLELAAQAGEVHCPYRVGEVIPLEKGVTGWVARERRPALVNDVSRDPRYIRGDRALGAELAVPIQIGDRLLGVLNIEDRQPGAYTPDDISLLQALADQLALAMSSLERQEELRRSQERLQGIYRLSERLPQIKDIDTLMQQAVEILTEHFAYEHAVIFLREGNELVLRGYHTMLPPEEVRLQSFRRLPLSQGICGRVARTGEPALVGDVSRDPDYLAGHPGIRSELAVPIGDGHEVLGVLNIESTQPYAFTHEDRELLQALARQLAVALRTLHYRRFLEELNRAQDPEELLRRILERAIAMLPQANAGSILLYDEEKRVYRFWAAIGREIERLQEIKYREEELLRVLRPDRPTILTRAIQLDNPITERIRRQLGVPPPGSTIALPIPDPESGRVIAFFNVNNLDEEGVFTEEDAQQLWELRDEIIAAVLRARDRERLRKMALHDALTGVYNRHYFTEYLKHEAERALRQGYPISFVLIDLDEFYAVNDRFGHATGDRVLQEVARVLQQNVRSHDVIVRYGGDEFLIVMSETTAAEAEAAMERLRKKFETWDPGLGEHKISISFGIASWQPGSGESLETVLERADEFMYHRRRKRAEERLRRKRAIIASTRAVEDPSAES